MDADDFAFNRKQLRDYAEVAKLPPVQDYIWDGAGSSGAGCGTHHT